MRRVIERVGTCRFKVFREGTHFDFLARSIIYQQLSGKAAATIYERVRALHGAPLLEPEPLLAVTPRRLRSAGLSKQKAAYVRDLASHVTTGRLDMHGLDALEDEAVCERLTQVNGVGRWTAQMYLMFRLGRPDVLPVTDLGVRKGVQTAYRLRALPEPTRVAKIGACWAPYRSVASWYLWRLLDVEAARAA